MKKILTTAILCAGLFSFTACSDFLDENPKSQLTTVGIIQRKHRLWQMSIICTAQGPFVR